MHQRGINVRKIEKVCKVLNVHEVCIVFMGALKLGYPFKRGSLGKR